MGPDVYAGLHSLASALLRRRTKPVNLRERDPEQIDEDVKYAVSVARAHISYVTRLGSIAGSVVLELGPGINFGPQLVLAGKGAKVIVADPFLARWDDAYHPEFYRRFRAAWDEPCPALDAVIAAGKYPRDLITLVKRPTEKLTPIRDRSVDFVLSNAVFEHLFDLDAAVRELARITKPGGMQAHQVDFRDHRSFDRPLEFLLLDDRAFKKLFRETRGETGNRRRANDVASLFERTGFAIEDLEINATADPAYMADFLPRLRSSASRFAQAPEADLTTLGARFFVRRSG